MNIAIIGPGAIGLLLAGYLHRGGARVMLVDESPVRAEHLNGRGFLWSGPGGDVTVRVPASVGLADPELADLAIICVKAYDTEEAARGLAAAGYRGPVLTLQNGAGNAEAIARALPGSPVIAGVTSEGANLAGEAHVRSAGRGLTSIGPIEFGRPGMEFLDRLAALMRDGGMSVEISQDPRSLIWGKVVINAAINPLTAILDVPNGALPGIGPARSLMADLVREGWEVVKAMRLSPQFSDPMARAEEVCRLTADNISSMCADIRNGRRTEVDFINGAIVREGSSRGVSCPFNEAVARIVRSLEIAKARRPPV